MPAKIIFFFPGTGDNGDYYASQLEDANSFNDQVIRVYFRGCQHKNIGGGTLFPDLDIAANKIRQAFEGKKLNIGLLKKNFGDGIYEIKSNIKGITTEISDIALQGFSRGAVTAFATAQKLDDLNIPIDIIANQPVPGQANEGSSSSLYSKNHDLSNCKNIRAATTLLATYNLENGFVQNSFFNQMVAKFSNTTKVHNLFLPHQSHLQWFQYDIVQSHIKKQFSEMNYSKKLDKHSELIKKSYGNKRNKFYYTPPEFMQTIFGAKDVEIIKDPLYTEVIIDDAKGFLKLIGFQDVQLNAEQANAILTINLLDIDIAEAEIFKSHDFYKFIISNTENAITFLKIINKTNEVIEFLRNVTDDGQTNKSALIKKHSIEYKKTIIKESYKYLTNDNPTPKSQQTFITEIKKAAKIFDNNALSIDRNFGRIALKVIINAILHLTGLFLISNSLNYYATGNYMFFSKTRSSSIIDKASTKMQQITKIEDNMVEDEDEVGNEVETLPNKSTL